MEHCTLLHPSDNHSSMKVSVSASAIYCCITTSPIIHQFKKTHTYFLTVSVGQKSWSGLAGSPGSGSPTGYSHLKAQLEEDHCQAPSHGWQQDSVPWVPLDQGPQFLNDYWLEASLCNLPSEPLHMAAGFPQNEQATEQERGSRTEASLFVPDHRSDTPSPLPCSIS